MITQKTILLFISDRLSLLLAYVLVVGPVGYFKTWVAKKMGDDTGEQQGLLTLNPLDHIDPLGLIALLLLGIGWGKNIIINPENIQGIGRTLKLALAFFANTFIYFMLALVALVGLTVFEHKLLLQGGASILESSGMTFAIMRIIVSFIQLTIILSVFSFVSNGVSFVISLLSEETEAEYAEYIFYASLILPLVIWMLFGNYIYQVFQVLLLAGCTLCISLFQ